MIQNILYCIFFGLVDLLIFLKLQKSSNIPKMYWYIGGIVVVLIVHLFGSSDYLMTKEDFLNLSFFSVGLIVLHFATNIQVATFKKYNVPQNEQGKKLQDNLLLVFDFMRQKLIYIMIYIYQFLAVWNENFR
jgi:hypothetical protein